MCSGLTNGRRGQLPWGAAGEGVQNSLAEIFHDYNNTKDSLMNELEVTYRNKLCYFGCQLVKIVISALHN